MKAFIVAISFCLGMSAFGQGIWFLKTYGNSGYDFGEDVKETIVDSGYIATGSSSSFGTATADAFLLKVDSLGNFMWSYNYGGYDSDWGEKVVITHDSAYAIAGYTNSYGAGGFDFYVIRTDTVGNPIWEQTYGGSDWDHGRSLVELPDSGFVVVGETYSFGAGNRDAYIIRIDKDGNEIWSQTYGGAEDDWASDVILDGDSIIVVGGTESYGAGGKDGLILKYHIDGTLGNVRYRGQADDDYFTSIIAKDTFYLLGGARSYHHDGGCDCGEDFWLHKIVNNLDTILADTSALGEQPGIDVINDVALYDANDNMYWGGHTTSWGAPDITEGLTDAFLGKHLLTYYYASDYVKNFGETNNDVVNGIDFCTQDQGIVSTGWMYFNSTGGYNMFIAKVDKLNTHGGYDVLTDLTTEIITLSIVDGSEIIQPRIYPTLVDDLINIEGISGEYQARVYSISGQLLLEDFDSPSNLDLAGFENGLYVVELVQGEQRYVQKVAKR